MRWRTVDGIQTEERADTPLGEYRVKAGGGRWAWYHESLDWAPVKSCDEAKREAEQHFYDECFKRIHSAFAVVLPASIQKTLAALGITPPPPEREPLVWEPWGVNGGVVAKDGRTSYFVVRIVDEHFCAHRHGGDCVRCLMQVGSLTEAKAACERDREASCR